MKKAYVAPAIEIIEYTTEDIMTASGITPTAQGMCGLLSDKKEASYIVTRDQDPLWFE